MPDGPRYDEDFYAWTQHQAAVLRSALRRDAETMLTRLYRDSRRRAALALRGHGEDGAADRLPADCPYTVDQILLDDWYPDPDGDRQ